MSEERNGPEMRDGALVHPLIQDWAEFWWMTEEDRAIAFDTRARAYDGEGYKCRPYTRERER